MDTGCVYSQSSITLVMKGKGYNSVFIQAMVNTYHKQKDTNLFLTNLTNSEYLAFYTLITKRAQIKLIRKELHRKTR